VNVDTGNGQFGSMCACLCTRAHRACTPPTAVLSMRLARRLVGSLADTVRLAVFGGQAYAISPIIGWCYDPRLLCVDLRSHRFSLTPGIN
jgi:hypothetical protein